MTEQDGKTRPRREDFQRALQSVDTFVDVSVDDLMMLSQRAEQYASQRLSKAIRVDRVMKTEVCTVQPRTPLSEAAHLMVTERISGLPVVDDRQQLIGIITEADFLRALGVPGHQPSHSLWQTLESMFTHLARHGAPQAPNAAVAEHMVREVVTAAPDQHLHDVLALMKRHRVKRVVVTDSGRLVVGIITRSDLVRIFFDPYTREFETDPA